MAKNTGEKKHARTKQWKPKVKTGCITCRIRRVKCDETKPNCERCTSTGRKCDGYTTSVPSTQTDDIACAPPQRSPLASAMTGLQLESVEEQEAFHFYRYHSAMELSGFFDASFWQCQIPQASHSLPALRHAMIALAAMHRKFISGRVPVVPDDISDKHLRFALRQSNCAIQKITQSPAQRKITDKISMMACCVLFHCLACIQGHHNVALGHLRSGLRILREIDEQLAAETEDTSAHPISLNTLRVMFVNMDVQARGIMSDESLASWEPQPNRDFALRPEPFKTLHQARFYIETTYNDVLAFIQGMDLRPPTTDEAIQTALREHRRLRSQFDTGSLLLAKFLCDSVRPSDKGDVEILLAIRLVIAQISAVLKAFKGFDIDTNTKEMDWGFAEQDLRDILDIAGQLSNARPDVTLPNGAEPGSYYPFTEGWSSNLVEVMPSQARPVFASGSAILMALWIVSSRARDATLRRKAIALLLEYPRREGLWDSILEGRVAWETMMLEESFERSCLDSACVELTERKPYIQEKNKIRDVAIKYTGLRVATVEFRNVEQYLTGKRGVVKKLAW